MWKTKGAIALALTVMLLPACAENRPEAAAPGTGNVTTEEVADNTNALLGQTVTVRSEPVKKIGPNTFTVSDDDFFGGETILVVNASREPVVLPEDDIEVQVTGKVAKFVLADVERDYDFLDLDPELYVEYEGKPAIIAQAVAPAPKPGEITANPSQYYGRTLAVAGEIENIVGPNAFTLDEDKLIGASDLLVLVANPKTANTAIKDGEYVAVTGVLRSFVVTDIERDYDLTWDLNLQRQLEVEYRNKPVLIVQSVYPSAVPPVAK
jgi:hypothetical protein